eukprot:1455562-Amphidinium_carterae.1
MLPFWHMVWEEEEEETRDIYTVQCQSKTQKRSQRTKTSLDVQPQDSRLRRDGLDNSNCGYTRSWKVWSLGIAAGNDFSFWG